MKISAYRCVKGFGVQAAKNGVFVHVGYGLSWREPFKFFWTQIENGRRGVFGYHWNTRKFFVSYRTRRMAGLPI